MSTQYTDDVNEMIWRRGSIDMEILASYAPDREGRDYLNALPWCDRFDLLQQARGVPFTA